MASMDLKVKSGVVESYTGKTAVLRSCIDSSPVIVDYNLDNCYPTPSKGDTMNYRETGRKDGVMHATYYKEGSKIVTVDGTQELMDAIEKFRKIDPGL